MEQEKQIPRWLLILGVLGPLLIVGSVALFVYVKQATMSFEYNFAYITCEGFVPRDLTSALSVRVTCGQYIQEKFQVSDGQVQVRDDVSVFQALVGPDVEKDTPPDFNSWTVRFYVYDTTAHTNRELTLDEFVTKEFITTKLAPDGTELKTDRSYNHSPFLIFGGTRGGPSNVLVKDGVQYVVDLMVEQDRWYWTDDYTFIGWLAKTE